MFNIRLHSCNTGTGTGVMVSGDCRTTSNPCRNNGTCVDQREDNVTYYCVCSPPWTGIYCDQVMWCAFLFESLASWPGGEAISLNFGLYGKISENFLFNGKIF